MLNENTDTEELEVGLSSMIKERLPEEKIALVLQSLKDIHLYAINGEPQGMKYVYFLTLVRHICNSNNVQYTSNIYYNHSKHYIKYLIYK